MTCMATSMTYECKHLSRNTIDIQGIYGKST